MPKNFQKTVIIRKFRQIPAKTGLESQCLCGVLEGTVEMEKARLGRRHHLRNRPSFYLNLCKMKEPTSFLVSFLLTLMKFIIIEQAAAL